MGCRLPLQGVRVFSEKEIDVQKRDIIFKRLVLRFFGAE